jgi:hypothetical protein
MVEISQLEKQNPWWSDPNSIANDPRIREYDEAKVKWEPSLLKYVDLSKDALYSIRGPRQVGKTTLVKNIIRRELARRKPTDVFFYACDLVNDAKELHDILESYITYAKRSSGDRKLIILDEISRVKDWETAYKALVDSQSLRGFTYIMTGSSSWDLKHSTERLPGRKGEENVEQNHKILLPMKFSEYVRTRDPALYGQAAAGGLGDSGTRKAAFLDLASGRGEKWTDRLLPLQNRLDELLDEYMLTGGLMPAVNCLQRHGTIRNGIYEMYLQLFFGDVARMNKDETIVRHVLESILRHSLSEVSEKRIEHDLGVYFGWADIRREVGVRTDITVTQYLDFLRSCFVANVYNAFDCGQKKAIPRSSKKIQITNPFFFHAFRGYLENPAGDYFQSAKSFLNSSAKKSVLAEAIVGDHLSRQAYRFRPTDLFDQQNSVFYGKIGSKRPDFVMRLPDRLLPVEVKYQSRINPEDYAALKAAGGGLLVTKETTAAGPIPTVPLPVFLMFV